MWETGGHAAQQCIPNWTVTGEGGGGREHGKRSGRMSALALKR